MRKNSLIFFVILLMLLISCSNREKDDNIGSNLDPTTSLEGNKIDEDIEYKIDENDITINYIDTNSFSYSLNKNEAIIIEQVALYSEDDLVLELDDEKVENLEDGKPYTLVITYYYEVNGEKISKEIRLEINLLPVPYYNYFITDDSITFAFQDSNGGGIKKIVINGNEYEVNDINLKIENLKSSTNYDYTIYFTYKDNNYCITRSFSTLDKDTFEVCFFDRLQSHEIRILYNKGDIVKIPDINTCHNGYAYQFGKYYVFKGFDVDINEINDDAFVNIIYDIKQVDEINDMTDLYSWMKVVKLEDIEKVVIGYYKDIKFMPLESIIVELTDISMINNVLTKLSSETMSEINDDDSYTSGKDYFIITFFINDFDYSIRFPIDKPFLSNGRMVSLELCKYLKAIVESNNEE